MKSTSAVVGMVEDADGIVEALDGLYEHKLHCFVLAEEVIKKALQDSIMKKQNRIRPQMVLCLRGLRSLLRGIKMIIRKLQDEIIRLKKERKCIDEMLRLGQ